MITAFHNHGQKLLSSAFQLSSAYFAAGIP